ncbi:MAG: hypothetical protein IH935_11580 [Acidobacteria bacterium]|nr:hypothetical protein [Acidobacteriota bacterium]
MAEAQRPTVGGAVRMSAGRVSEAPSAENWRDPSVWGGAEVISNFIQNEPVEGSPASERTEVRVAFDEEAIYVGAWLYDSEPSEIVVGEQRRDSLRQRKAEVEEQRRLQLGVFQKAQQQRKILENLRDRREQLYRQIQARREQQVLDELFLTRRALGPPS